MKNDRTNKVMVISGGLNPVGRKLSEAFASEGYSVVIWDDQYSKAYDFLKEFQKQNLPVEYVETELRKLLSVEMIKEKTLQKYGSIDILINCKGITDAGELPDKNFSQTEFSRIADLNLAAAMNTIRSVSPEMQERKFGRIINMTVLPVIHQYWEKHHDLSLREGMLGITKVWSRELAQHGITVNTLSSGFIRFDEDPAITQVTSKAVLAKIPVGRLCEMDDIVNALRFLISDQASYVNGILLPVDGGYTG